MSNIKFLQLKIGQQFEFQGEHFTKVAPLIASNDSDGKQRMIPRSAIVNLLDGNRADVKTTSHQNSHLQELLERYHQAVLEELQGIGGEVERLGYARARIEALHQALTEAIGQD